MKKWSIIEWCFIAWWTHALWTNNVVAMIDLGVSMLILIWIRFKETEIR